MANLNANAAKARVIEAVIKKLEKDREVLRMNIESTMQAARDAPGRMESRYDSTKAEKSFLAASLQEHWAKAGHSLQLLKEFRLNEKDAPEEVGIGNLVEAQTREREFYMILPAGGGESVMSEELASEVVIITPYSPLGNSLLGRKPGDTTTVNNRNITVVAIY